MAYETERTLLCDVWGLVKDASSITQARVSARSRLLAPRLGLDHGLSGPYLSDILSARPKRHPRVDRLKLAALALESVVRDQAHDVPIDNLVEAQRLLTCLLTDLRVQPFEWGVPGAPLSPHCLNLVRRNHHENRALEVLESGGNLFVGGGLGMGKSTMVNRILARWRERGRRAASVLVDTETAESNDIDRIYGAIGHAIGAQSPPLNRYSLEAALSVWLQSSPLPSILMLDGLNLLYTIKHGGSEFIRAILRGWTQKGQTGPPDGPWKQLRLLVTYSYTRSAHGAAVTSIAPAGFSTVECPPFNDSDTRTLISAYCDRDSLLPATGAQTDALQVEAREWFSGHPLLVHDLVDRWSSQTGHEATVRRYTRGPLSPLQESHLRTITAILQSLRQPSTSIKLVSQGCERGQTIGIDRHALDNLGVARFVGEENDYYLYEWTSFFYGQRLGPILAPVWPTGTSSDSIRSTNPTILP